MNKLIKILTITLLTISATIAGGHQFIGETWNSWENALIWGENPLIVSLNNESSVNHWNLPYNVEINSIEIKYTSDRDLYFGIRCQNDWSAHWFVLKAGTNQVAVLTAQEIYNSYGSVSFKNMLQGVFGLTFYNSITGTTNLTVNSLIINPTTQPVMSLPYHRDFRITGDVSDWSLNNVVWNNSWAALVFESQWATATMPMIPANATNLSLTVEAFYGSEIRLETSTDGVVFNTLRNSLTEQNIQATSFL